MFWFKPKRPISDEESAWIESGFSRLFKAFGRDFFEARATVLPTDAFFPDRFDGTEDAIEKLGKRIAQYMGLDPENLVVRVYADASDSHRQATGGVSLGTTTSKSAAGLYHPGKTQSGRTRIDIKKSLTSDPTRLVAVLAHENGHSLLIGGAKFDSAEKDHELLTDLTTVFCGMGVFTANAAFNFAQWQGGGRHGWSTSRQGYMSELQYGYALACYSMLKKEPSPPWLNYLDANVRVPCEQSLKYFRLNGNPKIAD